MSIKKILIFGSGIGSLVAEKMMSLTSDADQSNQTWTINRIYDAPATCAIEKPNDGRHQWRYIRDSHNKRRK